MRLRLSWGGATHAGRVRPANQDALFADHGLFVVADGMGGHQGGEVASRVAVRAMSGLEQSSLVDLADGVVGANAAVWEYAQKNPELMGMGTTLTAIGVIGSSDEPVLGLVNVGDSRIYLWRDGELEQVTDDHSYVAELVRRGQLDPVEAETHPYRNMLTRAIGVGEQVDVDSWEMVPEAGDRFILCSDGLVNEVTDRVIASIVAANPDPSEAAKLLIEQANTGGGRDNITVIVVNIDAEDAAPDALMTPPVDDETPSTSVDTGVFAPVSPGETTAELIIEADPFAVPVADDEVPLLQERTNALDDLELPKHDGEGPLPWLVEGEPSDSEENPDDPAPVIPSAIEVPAVEPDAAPAEPSPEEDDVPAVDPTPTEQVSAVTFSEPDSAVRIENPEIGEKIGASPSGWSSPVSITWRHIAGVLLVLSIAAGAIGLTGWYARSSYHVSFAGDEVVVFQGREGGVFWFEPTLEEGSGIYRSQLPEATITELEQVVEVTSLEAARAFIEGIRPADS
ncbi:MAG: Stp1/IreP family PP2C-type Ser/Thr phosphatase [Actinomycetia bacterium]|nr:Stp1/IreP family PP2C-type Ser/Thr phosphatase [Actinomycetes bacterium]